MSLALQERQIKRETTISIKAVNDTSRQITFVASNETVDLAGDVIRSDGWTFENYLKNPVVLWAHDSRELPVGKSVKVWIDTKAKALMATIEFAPTDDGLKLFELYKGGYMNAVSVGFRSLRSLPMPGNDERYWGPQEYLSQDLTEISCVPVPCNPDALSTDAKAAELAEMFEGFQKNYEAYTVQKANQSQQLDMIKTLTGIFNQSIKGLSDELAIVKSLLVKEDVPNAEGEEPEADASTGEEADAGADNEADGTDGDEVESEGNEEDSENTEDAEDAENAEESDESEGNEDDDGSKASSNELIKGFLSAGLSEEEAVNEFIKCLQEAGYTDEEVIEQLAKLA